METVNRQHGKLYKGHTIPYGTFVGVSDELKKVYYTHCYMRDEDMPEIPCPPYEHVECHNPEEEVFKKDMVRVVEEVLNGITPREKTVLCMRFGIGLTQDYSLEEIGNIFDVTRERIRQIEAKALRKMKHPSRIDVFKELLGWYETTAEKKAEAESARARWQKERAKAEEYRNARAQFKANAKQREKQRAQELEELYKEDLRLREKWEDVKPMVSDAAWVKHLEEHQPDMYQELRHIVKYIWGYNADKVWEMYAEKK